MTSNVEWALREMERLRMDSYEAPTERERRRLIRERNRIWKVIKDQVEADGR